MASAHSLNQKTAKIEDHGCCFWIKHSKTCAHIKNATVSIVAATALAALVIGVLLVLAHQGINLGGFNAIAKMIELKWLYMGVGFAAAVLLVDTVVIIALVRSYLNRAYTTKELQNIKIERFIKKHYIESKMEDNTYWKLTKEARKADDHKEGKPPVYAIAVKNKKEFDVIALKTEEDRDVYIKNLGKTYRDGKKVFESGTEYPKAYLDNFDLAAIEQRLSSHLRDGYCRSDSIKTPLKAEMVAAAKNNKVSFHYFKDPAKAAEFIKNYKKMPETYTLDEISPFANDTDLNFFTHFSPDENEFYPYEISIKKNGEEGQVFALAVKKGNQEIERFYYKTEEGRNDHPLKGLVDRKKFEAQMRSFARAMKINERSKNPNEYLFFTCDNNGISLYVLFCQKDKEGGHYPFIYWKTEKEREAATQGSGEFSEANGYYNIATREEKELKEKIHGADGIIAKQNLKAKATKDFEYFKNISTVNDSSCVVLIYKENNELSYRSFATEAECGKFLKTPEAKNLKSAPEYSPDYVEKVISKEHLEGVKTDTIEIQKHKRYELATYDIPTTDKANTIFALATTEGDTFEGKIRYFTSKAAREAFCRATYDSEVYSDYGAFMYALFGVPLPGMIGPTGVISSFSLIEMLCIANETFFFDFEDIWGRPLYGWVKATKKGFERDYRNSKEARSKLVKGYDWTDRIKQFDHPALKERHSKILNEKHLDKILFKDKEAWVEKAEVSGEKVDFLYYWNKGKLNSRFLEVDGTGRAEDILKPYKNIKQAFLDAVEYPAPLGEYLAEKANWKKSDLEIRISRMLTHEFWDTSLQNTHDKEYPHVAICLVKDKKGNIEFHYFKNEKDHDIFTNKLFKEQGYTAGYIRHKAYEIHAKDVAQALNGTDEPKKSFYKIEEVYEDNGKNKARLITVTFVDATHEWTAESIYDDDEKIEEKIKSLKGYKNIEECLAEASDQTLEEWKANGKLTANTFAIVPICNGLYNVLLVRNDENDEIESSLHKSINDESVHESINDESVRESINDENDEYESGVFKSIEDGLIQALEQLKATHKQVK